MVTQGKHFLQIPGPTMCPTGIARDGHADHRSSRPDSRNWDSTFSGLQGRLQDKTPS